MLPSAVFTVIVALPADFAVTNPLLLTVATPALLLVHVTPLLDVLLGVTVADSCLVAPTVTVADVGLTLIPVANCFTVTALDTVSHTLFALSVVNTCK